MVDIPKQLNGETDSDYALFLSYLSPQEGVNPLRAIEGVKTGLSPSQLRVVALRNRWVSRALNWDIETLKAQHTPNPPPAKVIANALIKLAGSTLAGNARTDEHTIAKAIKLIDGYCKLK